MGVRSPRRRPPPQFGIEGWQCMGLGRQLWRPVINIVEGLQRSSTLRNARRRRVMLLCPRAARRGHAGSRPLWHLQEMLQARTSRSESVERIDLHSPSSQLTLGSHLATPAEDVCGVCRTFQRLSAVVQQLIKKLESPGPVT
jgi:hypothetical protein